MSNLLGHLSGFALLTGHFPFYDAESDLHTRDLIINAPLRWPVDAIPPEAAEVIKFLLKRKRKDRRTPADILQLPFLAS